jgi:hypothetical protein
MLSLGSRKFGTMKAVAASGKFADILPLGLPLRARGVKPPDQDFPC